MIYDNGRSQTLLFGGKKFRYQPLSYTQTIPGHNGRLAPPNPPLGKPHHPKAIGLVCRTAECLEFEFVDGQTIVF